MMELTVLGSGCARASTERGQAGYVVRSGETQVAIDFGSGTLGRTVRAGLRPEHSAALLVTHVHPDHITDLVAVLFEIKYQSSSRREPLVVYGPPAFTPVFDHVMSAFGQWCIGETYDVVPREVESEAFAVGSLTIRPFPVRHSVPALGYRLTCHAGRTLVFTGDAGWEPELVEHARGANLLVADASAVEGDGVHHLDLARVSSLAESARVDRVLLTHLSEEVDAVDAVALVRNGFRGGVAKAQDLARYEV
jgi:ribonuclease BN (tRNA processing enzyme)